MEDIYILENDKLRIKIGSIGATILSIYDKKLKRDIVGGFDSVKEYLKRKDIFFGATIGRCANRIKNGLFKLNDKEYNLFINNGPNSLHGGLLPFSYEEFKLEELKDNYLVLSYYSVDLESGYPGNLDFKVKYILDENKLRIEYSGISDKDTLFNITNHTYFNLANFDENIFNHELYIPSNRINITDKDGLSLEEELEVKDTAFDFNKYKKIGEAIITGNKYMNLGIDNNYIQENSENNLKASLKYKNIKVSVYSDLPDVQIYTSNYFDGFKGRDNKTYEKFMCVAIEPQFVPNSINYSKYLKPIIKKDELVTHYIEYKIED